MKMIKFPRTTVGGMSLSRMIIGTNWFLGYSHTTRAKDCYINEHIKDRKKIADILEIFFKYGVDTIIGNVHDSGCAPLVEGIKETEDRTGIKAIVIATPGFQIDKNTPTKGFDSSKVYRILDAVKAQGAAFCMPHAGTTDSLVDRCTREIRHMPALCKMIREHGMIPGLSTHMPETVIYADDANLDVATYIQIYNALGFLMQIEVDWIAYNIQNAKKPVMTIKPLAAGQLRPFQGLNFVWNTIRPQDMVTIGTISPKEAEEVVELSLAILERRQANVQLQETRSKSTVKSKNSRQ